MSNSVQILAPRPAVASPAQGWALAPMLSGARARGFADGLEWLGLAAALIDDRGEALHLNAGAIEMMGDDLYLEAGRIRAVDPGLDASIASAITETLMTGATTEVAFSDRRAMTIRLRALDSAGDDPCQLMRAVAVFETAGRA